MGENKPLADESLGSKGRATMATRSQGPHLLVLCVLGLAASQGRKLLVVPVDGSHWLSMRGVIQQLRQTSEGFGVAPTLAVSLHISVWCTFP